MGNNKSFNTARIDYTLIFVVFVLACLSVLGIGQAYEGMDSAIKQIVWYIIGAAAATGIFFFDYDRLLKLIWFFYGFIIFLLLGLLAFKMGAPIPLAHESNGAYSWYQIPGLGTLQPAEFMKTALIITLSKLIFEHNEKRDNRTIEDDLWLLGKLILATAPPTLLVLVQPDLGSALVLVAIFMALLVISGIRWRIILTIIGLVILFAVLMILSYFRFPSLLKALLEEHQFNRFSGWIYPEKFSNGMGYQLLQSLTSIGSGQLYGRGINAKEITVPFGETDFIFSVIAGHFGFLGASILISVLFILIYRIVNAALKTHDPFGSYICTGIVGMLTFTIFENIGMTIQLMPITGIPLPFVSYGGSSLLNNMICIGLVLSVEVRSRKYMFD